MVMPLCGTFHYAGVVPDQQASLELGKWTFEDQSGAEMVPQVESPASWKFWKRTGRLTGGLDRLRDTGRLRRRLAARPLGVHPNPSAPPLTSERSPCQERTMSKMSIYQATRMAPHWRYSEGVQKLTKNWVYVLAVAISILPARLPAEESATTELSVGSAQERIVFQHPATWKAKVSGPTFGPTLEFSPKGEGDFRVLITAIPRGNGKAMSDQELAGLVREHGEKLLPTAVQKELEIRSVKGDEASGYLYHLTDREPETGPGDYREVHQGSVVVGSFLLSVTVLTHTSEPTVVDSAFRALGSARYRTGRE